jgi:hypothetical protein
MEKLLQELETLCHSQQVGELQLTMATPIWSAGRTEGEVQVMAVKAALSFGERGVTVIPAAAKKLKEAGHDIVVTRDGVNGVISIVLYTAYGSFILYWDKESVGKWIDVHRTAVLTEPAVTMPPYRRGVLGALAHVVDVIRGKSA